MSKEHLAAISPAENLQREFREELFRIGEWWLRYGIDEKYGGFFGEISVLNAPVGDAPKSVVLNSRILWFFSSLAVQSDDVRFQEAALRAYDYICRNFFDDEYGGYFWALTADGKPLDTKKQVYAQAFVIYALSAYFELTEDPLALRRAKDCFRMLEEHTLDKREGGYFEAFTRDWQGMDDVRLSDKDMNAPKTMNTHLHVLEAYCALYKVAPSADLKAALAHTIQCFDHHIIDRQTGHVRMFMSTDWQDQSPGYTYGHDIECSWLLLEALESLQSSDFTRHVQPAALQLAQVCLDEALGKHGEVLDGLDFASGNVHSERIWWVQAEGLVGFLKAWSLTSEQSYFLAADNIWQFIKRYHRDTELGEWFWLATLCPQPNPPHYKAGFWKGPYHNGRAMIEATKLLAARF